MSSQNLNNEPWTILNKCDRMVATYIADMDKFLSYSEWPDSYPEPMYLSTLEKYIDRVRFNASNITNKTKDAKQSYFISIIVKLIRYKRAINNAK